MWLVKSKVVLVCELAAVALCGSMALTGRAANVTEADTSWWSLSGGVLTLNNSNADISDSTNIYSLAIGVDIDKIVKTGPGAVRLSGNNQYFTGEIDVQAGILMGWVKEKVNTSPVQYTENNYGHPSKVTVANNATFEMLSTPCYSVVYQNSEFSTGTPTAFHIQGSGLNGMGALRRQCDLVRQNERSYATIKSLTLDGDAMIWVGMRWGFNDNNNTLDMNYHSLTVAGPATEQKIFNFCRGGLTEILHPGNIVINHTQLLFENYVPKDHSAAQVAGTYMVITNSGGCYFYVNQANVSPLYWDIKSYGGDIRGASTSASQSWTSKFAGNLELLAGTTYLYNSNSAGNPEIEISGTVNGPGKLSTQHASDQNVKTTLRGGGMGGNNLFNRLEIPYGTVVLTDADRFTITNGMAVGGTSKTGKFAATLVVTNTTLFMQPGNGKPYLAVGEGTTSDPVFGVVDIRQGAVVTNDMFFAKNNKNAGALYLSGNAKLYWLCGSGSNKFLGNGGCAFMGIRDNALIETLGYLSIGGVGGRSFVIQRGGTYRNARSTVASDTINDIAFKIGRSNGMGHYYQCGGTQTSQGSLCLNWDWPDNVYNANGAYTVDGSSATAEFNDACWCITLAGTANSGSAAGRTAEGTFSTVNVNNGGTFVVNRMYKSMANHVATGVNWTWATTKDVAPNSWAYLNFNGGVLKIKGNGDFFSADGTAENARMPTRVTVYSGGAVIDTNGKDSTWRMPLEKPYGKGVASITLASSVLNNANYICPPAVRFEGDGSNATAIVNFDEAQRQNTGVIVTSPGFGFSSAPTVKIEKDNCDNSSFYTDATVTMVDFDAAGYAHGGLTKRGAGTLTLAGVNTYGGATRLEGGTLAFANVNGYPGGDLEVAADAVRTPPAAPLLTAETLTFAAGKGVRLTEADTLDRKTFGRMRTIATFTTPLAQLPSLVLVNSDGTECESGGRWCLQLADGGRTLKLGALRGMSVSFK